MTEEKPTPDEKDPAIEAESGTSTPANPEPEKTPAEQEFPSLVGEPEVEVAERSQDETADEADTFRKDFVLLKSEYDLGDKEAIHAANEDAVRQILMQNGLRPEQATITHRTKKHPDGASIIITYRAKAVPAAVTNDPEVAHARVDGEPVFPADKSAE